MKQITIFLLLAAFSVKAQKKVDTSAFFCTWELQAEYPGGQRGLEKFVYSRLNYDAINKNGHVHGRVYAFFVIEKDGSVDSIRIVRGLSRACDEEVLRVLKLMPRWRPAVVNGRQQRTAYSLPVQIGIAKVDR